MTGGKGSGRVDSRCSAATAGHAAAGGEPVRELERHRQHGERRFASTSPFPPPTPTSSRTAWTTRESSDRAAVCAVHGLRRIGSVIGEDILLTSVGTMGLLLLQLLNKAGARSVSVVDRSGAFTGAKALGAVSVLWMLRA